MSKGKRKKRSKEKKGENLSTGNTAVNHEEQASDLHAPLHVAKDTTGEPRPKKRSKHDKHAEPPMPLSSPKESPIDSSAGNDNKSSDASDKDKKKRAKKKRRKKKRKTSTDPSCSSSLDVDANPMSVPPESKKRKTVGKSIFPASANRDACIEAALMKISTVRCGQKSCQSDTVRSIKMVLRCIEGRV